MRLRINTTHSVGRVILGPSSSGRQRGSVLPLPPAHSAEKSPLPFSFVVLVAECRKQPLVFARLHFVHKRRPRSRLNSNPIHQISIGPDQDCYTRGAPKLMRPRWKGLSCCSSNNNNNNRAPPRGLFLFRPSSGLLSFPALLLQSILAHELKLC